MNLKEAFRFQNRLNELSTQAREILLDNYNITKVQKTYLRHKVIADVEDETTVVSAPSEYSEHINEVIDLLLFLLNEQEKLAYAIRETKKHLDVDIDNETMLNVRRQTLMNEFKRMADLRSSETVLHDGGNGYRFNTDGEQVRYHCDVRQVTTINFDRRKVKRLAMELCDKSDATSHAIDCALVNSTVDYAVPFNVNDSFASVFETICPAVAS